MGRCLSQLVNHLQSLLILCGAVRVRPLVPNRMTLIVGTVSLASSQKLSVLAPAQRENYH